MLEKLPQSISSNDSPQNEEKEDHLEITLEILSPQSAA
jgi:hypothetical protein